VIDIGPTIEVNSSPSVDGLGHGFAQGTLSCPEILIMCKVMKSIWRIGAVISLLVLSMHCSMCMCFLENCLV